MTRKLEDFKPFDDKNVKMCTYGPTIYSLPRIGNYRTFLFEDVLYRYSEYLGYDAKRALNITDVEDRAIVEAEKEGITLKDLTESNTKVFLRRVAETESQITNISSKVFI